MPVNKKKSKTYWYWYWRRRRQARRFRYVTGSNNYYRARIDIPVQIGFSAGSTNTDVKMYINEAYFTDVSISNLVGNNLQYSALKNIFDQVKLKGVKFYLNIANIINFANPIQFVLGYANNDNTSFNSLINDNRSLTLNLNGVSKRYIPLNHLDFVNSNTLADTGYISIRGSTASTLASVPIIFSGVFSLYLLFKYNTS